MRYQHDVLRLVCGDGETAPIDAAGEVHASHMPYPMTVTGVRASLTTGPTSGTLLVDIEEEGVSILDEPIELAAGETTSTAATNLPFIVDNVLGDAALITVVIVDEASGDAAGLKVDIIGHRWIIPFVEPYGLSGPSGEGVGLPIVPIPPPPSPLSVTINQGSGQADPTTLSSIVFDVVFSEAVSGFATGDVTLSGTAGGTLVGTVTGSDDTYTVTVTGMTSAGTVIASIGAGVCTAVSSGVPNQASTSTDNTVTWAAFDPTTMTNLEWWVEAGTRTENLGVITHLTNLGTDGGTFVHGSSTPAVAGTDINGHDTIDVAATSTYTSVAVGRWLSDDIYDVYMVVKGAAQVNKALWCQHDNTVTVGRCVFGSANDGTGAKAAIFFNNGSSHSGNSTATPFDNTPHLIRWHSTGGGDHYIQVDGGTDELVISGQAFTPMNTNLRLFALGLNNNAFTGTFCEVFGCRAVQSAEVAAAATDYLMNKWGI